MVNPFDNSGINDKCADRLRERLAAITLLAMDVDGVLTDGTLEFDNNRAEGKRFHVADGLGITLMKLMGISVAWITGRNHTGVERRAAELEVDHLLVGIRDKGRALRDLMDTLHLDASTVAYIGDDWNDLPAFGQAGVRIAVSNAVSEVRQQADYVTVQSGGQGAVREVCEAILDASGIRSQALQSYLSKLASEGMNKRSGQ